MKPTKFLATAVAVALGSLALTSYTNAVTITPWTAPDYIDTEWNVFKMGSLTIESGDLSITILDRNLWATETWTSCSDYNTWACGYFFQWWNNYWFSIPLTKTGDTTVNATSYSRSNPYISDTFRIINNNPYDWADRKNDNLRWWVWDTQNNFPNRDYMRQWPCPEWYHVPTYRELQTLATLAGPSNTWNFANTNFLLPFAGIYGSFPWGFGDSTYLWSSSPFSNVARMLWFCSNGTAQFITNRRSGGYSIRCFYNSRDASFAAVNSALSTLILSFDTRGWQKMQGQVVLINRTGHTPWYEPKKAWDEFIGWYKDESCSQPFDFQTDIITGNTTIYAKWANDSDAGSGAGWSTGQVTLTLTAWENTCTLNDYNLWTHNVSSEDQNVSTSWQNIVCEFLKNTSATIQLSMWDLVDGTKEIWRQYFTWIVSSLWNPLWTIANLTWWSYNFLSSHIIYTKEANTIWTRTWSLAIEWTIPAWTPSWEYTWELNIIICEGC